MFKPVYAVDFSNPATNPAAKVGNIGMLVNFLGPLAMAIGAFICLAMLLWGGFLYITSGGEQDKIQQGKRTLTYALIGLVVMITAMLFVNVLAYVLGVKSFFAK
ncbi:hypothetical protein HYS00_05540 [Candidatus Microgenomates bacterium]|nr:hypothetical protein [Candidatus Microgenomates bacterium]